MAGFERIGVVGAGMMGSEIALMFALLRQMAAAGYNGRKAGRGWRRYGSDGERL
jgi:3-hydroxyacyl-CoA dehydrogenase